MEFSAITAKGTRLLVPRVSNIMRVIGCSWKYRIERDISNAVVKNKVHLVARGDMQDLDYASFFAPTARYTTLQVLLALACYYDLEIEQMGVVIQLSLTPTLSRTSIWSNRKATTSSPLSGTRLVCKFARRGPLQHPRSSSYMERPF